VGLNSFEQQVTFLLVTDLERSTEFYRDVLGLEVVLDQGDCRILRITDTAFLGICERPNRPDPGAVLVTLVTDAVDERHKDLVAAGATCEQPPQLNTKYNVYHAFYRDPDGFLVEIQRFLDSAWPRVNP
jgi:catechol 2,3-dioxygenase-like lactoylglutathione lyase family enzyme